jgi:hypothetical protein
MRAWLWPCGRAAGGGHAARQLNLLRRARGRSGLRGLARGLQPGGGAWRGRPPHSREALGTTLGRALQTGGAGGGVHAGLVGSLCACKLGRVAVRAAQVGPEVARVTADNAFMAELHSRLVPIIVEPADFWSRYFYRWEGGQGKLQG